MNTFVKSALPVLAVLALAGCEVGPIGDRGIVDTGIDGGPLQDGVASIWLDPDGCQHWVIDDGLEGYMSPRLNRDGTPRCTPREDERTAMIAKDGTTILMEPEPRR